MYNIFIPIHSQVKIWKYYRGIIQATCSLFYRFSTLDSRFLIDTCKNRVSRIESRIETRKRLPTYIWVVLNMRMYLPLRVKSRIIRQRERLLCKMLVVSREIQMMEITKNIWTLWTLQLMELPQRMLQLLQILLKACHRLGLRNALKYWDLCRRQPLPRVTIDDKQEIISLVIQCLEVMLFCIDSITVEIFTC